MIVPEEREWTLNSSDIIIFTTKDSGPGGQHRNKTESCVIMRHIPTNIEAKAATKSQHRNKVIAREMLESRVISHLSSLENAVLDKKRKDDRGSGMRGDKIRTYREKDDTVSDHKSDTKYRLRDIRSGKLESMLIASNK